MTEHELRRTYVVSWVVDGAFLHEAGTDELFEEMDGMMERAVMLLPFSIEPSGSREIIEHGGDLRCPGARGAGSVLLRRARSARCSSCRRSTSRCAAPAGTSCTNSSDGTASLGMGDADGRRRHGQGGRREPSLDVPCDRAGHRVPRHRGQTGHPGGCRCNDNRPRGERHGRPLRDSRRPGLRGGRMGLRRDGGRGGRMRRPHTRGCDRGQTFRDHGEDTQEADGG